MLNTTWQRAFCPQTPRTAHGSTHSPFRQAADVPQSESRVHAGSVVRAETGRVRRMRSGGPAASAAAAWCEVPGAAQGVSGMPGRDVGRRTEERGNKGGTSQPGHTVSASLSTTHLFSEQRTIGRQHTVGEGECACTQLLSTGCQSKKLIDAAVEEFNFRITVPEEVIVYFFVSSMRRYLFSVWMDVFTCTSITDGKFDRYPFFS